MRKPASRQSAPYAQTARTAFIPAPVGGLNTRDPPALVPVTEAFTLSNFYPSAGGLTLRKGYLTHISSGISGTIETLMTYNTPAGTETMFAAADNAGSCRIYNVTSSGAASAAVVTGLTSARIQYVNFTNSSGTSYLCCFNGADSPRYWDGATWITITGVSTPAITGLTTSDIIAAATHQRRMWLVQKDSLKAWYLPVDSVGGAANAIELGGIASKGGHIKAIGTLTIDGGSGIDDYLIIVTSEGQVVGFQGTDPSDASAWALVGVWEAPVPIGRRCLSGFKGDLLIITSAGLLSTKRLIAGESGTQLMITDKIRKSYEGAYAQVATDGEFGWQLTYFAGEDMLIFSPSKESDTYLMNGATGAWSGKIGTNICWVIFNGGAYYAPSASSNYVRQFWAYDGGDDGGTQIQGLCRWGYSDFGATGAVKKVNLMRLAVTATNSVGTVALGVKEDYGIGSLDVAPSPSVSIGALTSGVTPPLPVNGLGISLSAAAYISSAQASVVVSGLHVTYEIGGITGSLVET